MCPGQLPFYPWSGFKGFFIGFGFRRKKSTKMASAYLLRLRPSTTAPALSASIVSGERLNVIFFLMSCMVEFRCRKCMTFLLTIHLFLRLFICLPTAYPFAAVSQQNAFHLPLKKNINQEANDKRDSNGNDNGRQSRCASWYVCNRFGPFSNSQDFAL